MARQIQSHQARPLKDELEELHKIAEREHGPHARSTKRIREALDAVNSPQAPSRQDALAREFPVKTI